VPPRASGWIARLFWLFFHILFLVGFRNRGAALGEWAWSYLTAQRRGERRDNRFLCVRCASAAMYVISIAA